MTYMLLIYTPDIGRDRTDEEWAAKSRRAVVVREDIPQSGLDLTLERGAMIRGRVTAGSAAPVHGVTARLCREAGCRTATVIRLADRHNFHLQVGAGKLLRRRSTSAPKVLRECKDGFRKDGEL